MKKTTLILAILSALLLLAAPARAQGGAPGDVLVLTQAVIIWFQTVSLKPFQPFLNA